MPKQQRKNLCGIKVATMQRKMEPIQLIKPTYMVLGQAVSPQNLTCRTENQTHRVKSQKA